LAVKILAGDVGGTNTRLLVARCGDSGPAVLREKVYSSQRYSDLATIIGEFSAEAEDRPVAACIGVAGPVTAGEGTQTASVTNLPWKLDSRHLESSLGIARVRIINDFEAIGHGIPALGADDLLTLQQGQALAGAPCAVLGAGTGLGQALLIGHEPGYEVLPTEGGHADFAPQDDEQISLLRALQRRFGHVSWERVLSGPGLISIYHFLGENEGRLPDTGSDIDAAPEISRKALGGADPLAARALGMFIRIYGAQAGNLALTALARGGVYLAGGIASSVLRAENRDTFMQAFNSKGRMSELTRQIPVHVIQTTRVGLIGAVRLACRLAAADADNTTE
jgi:glucokinase